jgi:hypothetical protein
MGSIPAVSRSSVMLPPLFSNGPAPPSHRGLPLDHAHHRLLQPEAVARRCFAEYYQGSQPASRTADRIKNPIGLMPGHRNPRITPPDHQPAARAQRRPPCQSGHQSVYVICSIFARRRPRLPTARRSDAIMGIGRGTFRRSRDAPLPTGMRSRHGQGSGTGSASPGVPLLRSRNVPAVSIGIAKRDIRHSGGRSAAGITISSHGVKHRRQPRRVLSLKSTRKRDYTGPHTSKYVDVRNAPSHFKNEPCLLWTKPHH